MESRPTVSHSIAIIASATSGRGGTPAMTEAAEKIRNKENAISIANYEKISYRFERMREKSIKIAANSHSPSIIPLTS
jgi:hypothetical protein